MTLREAAEQRARETARVARERTYTLILASMVNVGNVGAGKLTAEQFDSLLNSQVNGKIGR